MASNRLMIHGNYGAELDTGTEIILAQDHERMLECEISSNFFWKEPYPA